MLGVELSVQGLPLAIRVLICLLEEDSEVRVVLQRLNTLLIMHGHVCIV